MTIMIVPSRPTILILAKHGKNLDSLAKEYEQFQESRKSNQHDQSPGRDVGGYIDILLRVEFKRFRLAI